MKAKSIKGNSPAEIKAALAQSMADGFNPTLAIVFISILMDVRGTMAVLEEAGLAIFGASTAGEFTDSGIAHHSAAILLLDIPATYFHITLSAYNRGEEKETARHIGEEGKKAFRHPAVMMVTSHLETPGEYVMEGLTDALGPDVTIIGGVAGDDLLMQGGIVFTNHTSSERAICALFLDQDKIDIRGMAVSGWKGVGTTKTVTKSKGNWIETIDDQPALDMLIKFTGLKVDFNGDQNLLTQIGMSFPLQVIRDKGIPTMKPPLMYNRETKAVMTGGYVPQGSSIRFSLPPDFDVVDTVIESAQKIKDNTLRDADAMIVFSCIGRFSTLGPLIEAEIDGLKQVWNAPLAGFFSYGEYGRTEGGDLDFHGTTCSWVALSEK
ncbi:MAG: FIST C-terminal domain-containing protein [Saprospiraceae bacterium]|nr:FIST C-terminal domain-containing protein [Candidatus Opimibacter skivensis]